MCFTIHFTASFSKEMHVEAVNSSISHLLDFFGGSERYIIVNCARINKHILMLHFAQPMYSHICAHHIPLG